MPFLGFWEKLPRPFFALAPMADVTDTVFRQVIAQHGRPDVFWTEFVACDGLCSEGRSALIRDLQYTEGERPIVAQIFGANPDTFYETARLVVELGFDGVDINMGCPDKSVMKQGAGASLMKTPELAQSIIRATQAGVRDSNRMIPVSVKTRAGYLKDKLDEWLPKILETEPALITLHARTKKEMSTTPAHWDWVARAVEMARGSGTLIVGNGDVKDLADARMKATQTGANGIMLGRAVFGNPWLFNRDGFVPSLEDKLRAMVEHTEFFEQKWGNTKNFQMMKKHYQAYVNGFDGAKALRVQLMGCETASQVRATAENFLKNRG
ncbi:MAG: tRNA-dihydrouridine synthase [Candidatus Moraniibacteriota bacterium]